MAQRDLRVADVFRGTGIARATLAALVHNRGVGMQYDTMDKLCRFLHVTPGDLYSFCDFSYEIMDVITDSDKLRVKVFAQVESHPLTSPASVTWSTNGPQLHVLVTYDKALYALLQTVPTNFRQVLDTDLANRIPVDMKDHTLHIRVTSA